MNADGTPYEFKNTAGDTVTNQIIKNGEVLENVGYPTIDKDEVFNGWYIWNPDTETWGEQIQFDTEMTVSETKTIYVKANVGEVGYLTFYEDSEGTIILTKKQVPIGTTYDISQQTLPSPEAGLVFVGWNEAAGTNDDSRTAITNTTVTVTGDKSYYPVYKQAHWLTFVTSKTGAGAEYVASQYVLNGEKTVEPDDPEWTGYDFAYWSTTPHVYEGEGDDTVITNDGSDGKFTFGGELTEDTTLYAYWDNADTNYTIVYWKQNVTDDKNASDAEKTYSYFTMEQATGKAHETVNIPTSATTKATTDTANFTGFKYNASKSDTSITVDAKGSSIMNVYYDRELVTMQFYANGTSAPNDGYNWNQWDTNTTYVTTFTGLYGQTLAQNGYTWPTNGHYTYYNNNNGTTGMTYLGQFVLPDGVRNNSKTLLRLYRDSSSTNYTVYYYLETVNGTYNSTADATGGGNGTFNFSEKYDGFNVVQYRRLYQNGQAAENWQTATVGSSVGMTYQSGGWNSRTNYYNLEIRYQRKNYTLHYLDSVDNSKVLTDVTVKYGAPLTSYKPASNVTPESAHAGKEFDGKWYADAACSAEFDWANSVMPNGDVNVYAGWEDIWYWIKVDPDGGVIDSQTGGATWFWETYGNLAEEYGFIQKDYIKDDNGTFYYHYDEFNNDDPNGTQPATRYGYYTTDASLSTDGGQKYSYSDDAYALVGWYDVDLATDKVTTPHNFKAGITDNVYIRAVWRRVGDYKLIYDPVSADGIEGTNAPTDSARYADKSDTAILGSPTAPAGYVFTGWDYNGTVYKAGDVIQVDADLANENSEITITAVYTKYEDQPIGVTHINWYGNMYDVAGLEIPGVTSAKEYAKTADDIPYNEAVEIADISEVVTGNEYDNYTFLGWAKKDVSDTSKPIFSENDLFLKYNEDGTYSAKDSNGNWVEVSSVGADEDQPYQDLYAVWQAEFYVYHSGAEGDGALEKIVMNSNNLPNGTYDLTSNLTEDTLYGGYYLDYEGKGTYADDGQPGKDGEKYTGMNITWSDAQDKDGTKLVPKAGETYYVKEVPTYYLLPYYQYTYTKADKIIRNIYMMSAIDDLNYDSTGFVIITDREAKVYSSYSIATVRGGKSVKFTASTMFKKQGLTSGGKVTEWEGTELLDSESFIMRPYWVTADGVKVLGSTERHVDLGNGQVGTGGISKDDQVVGPEVVK